MGMTPSRLNNVKKTALFLHRGFPYRPRQTLNQLQKWEQTNKIYADNSAILICYPQLEQVFQQYLSQSVFLCWEENKKVSKQISLYLFNNFFLYVYIKGSFQEK